MRKKDQLQACRPIPNGCLIPNTPCFMINTGNMAFFHLGYDDMFLLHERYADRVHREDTMFL